MIGLQFLRRGLFVGAFALALISTERASAAPGFIDQSRADHPAIQCMVTVTATATTLASLWATACPSPTYQQIPKEPQFAFVTPMTGVIAYRTDLVAPTVFNGSAARPTDGQSVQTNQSWPVEGRPSILGDGGIRGNGLTLVAASNIPTMVEIRW